MDLSVSSYDSVYNAYRVYLFNKKLLRAYAKYISVQFPTLSQMVYPAKDQRHLFTRDGKELPRIPCRERSQMADDEYHLLGHA